MGLREVPRVKVICRHRDECKRKDKGTTYLRCDCPKTLYWCLAGSKPAYESAGTTDYQVAERRARDKEAEFAAVADGEAPKPEGKPVREAVEEYLRAKTDVGMDVDYISWLTRILGSLADFCDRNAVPELPDVRVTHLEKWRSSWTVGKSTASKWQGYTKSFFKWAARRDYVKVNQAEKLDPIKDGGTKQKRALTDAQLSVALDALELVAKWPEKRSKRQFRALILLQRWTGLALQDAVTTPRASLKRGADGFYRVFLRRDKTDVDVNATIPPAIGDEILGVINPANPEYLFWDGKCTKRAELTQPWIDLYCRLAKQPAVAALKDEQGRLPFSSHIMRHSFAAYLLLQGMDIVDVAKLLGHRDTKITEAHYSGWSVARQERLSERSKEVFMKWQASQPAITSVPLTQ